MSLDKGTKEEITKKFQLHEKDTGSADVQIAILTERIAELTGHKLSTVYRTLTNFKERNTVEGTEGSGRPKKLDERNIRALVNYTRAIDVRPLAKLLTPCRLKCRRPPSAGYFM